jgi:hypothetical protein
MPSATESRLVARAAKKEAAELEAILRSRERFMQEANMWHHRVGSPIRRRLLARAESRRRSRSLSAKRRREKSEERFKTFINDVDQKLATMMARQERWKRGEYSK